MTNFSFSWALLFLLRLTLKHFCFVLWGYDLSLITKHRWVIEWKKTDRVVVVGKASICGAHTLTLLHTYTHKKSTGRDTNIHARTHTHTTIHSHKRQFTERRDFNTNNKKKQGNTHRNKHKFSVAPACRITNAANSSQSYRCRLRATQTHQPLFLEPAKLQSITELVAEG